MFGVAKVYFRALVVSIYTDFFEGCEEGTQPQDLPSIPVINKRGK